MNQCLELMKVVRLGEMGHHSGLSAHLLITWRRVGGHRHNLKIAFGVEREQAMGGFQSIHQGHLAVHQY